ncbi:hypothetical protein CHH83_26360 [Bacillus sp. 7586-K]|uniref:hypothetical protein n=1 Tax=Metabacillus niabensis TaxID=324854 RepID=UPI000BA69CF5|nr:hypothetical protein CHH83_26360 [Bacillus sp. 7586-K]
MERLLVKTAIYSFITSYLVLLAFIDRVRMTTDVNGMNSAEEIPYPDFFLMNLKYSIMITFSIVMIVFLYKKYKKIGEK